MPEELGERYALWREHPVVEVDCELLRVGEPAEVGVGVGEVPGTFDGEVGDVRGVEALP